MMQHSEKRLSCRESMWKTDVPGWIILHNLASSLTWFKSFPTLCCGSQVRFLEVFMVLEACTSWLIHWQVLSRPCESTDFTCDCTGWEVSCYSPKLATFCILSIKTKQALVVELNSVKELLLVHVNRVQYQGNNIWNSRISETSCEDFGYLMPTPHLISEHNDSIVKSQSWYNRDCAGHYHLSQDYGNSISVRNRCSFAQVGVIGECDRDGQHQSRILRGTVFSAIVSTPHPYNSVRRHWHQW